MHRLGFFLLAFAQVLGASTDSSPVEKTKPLTESQACAKEIQLIDQEVQKLEQQKQKHQDLARQYQQKGDQWRYYSGNIQDAYVNWGKANEERQKAIDIQQQIDSLLLRRQTIMQFYPELWQP
jgi:hypothetical protein